MSRLALILCLAAAVAINAWPAQKKKSKKKNDEPVTQVLELPKEPPAAVVSDAGRLIFQTSPLSARGLMSQQLHDALRWVLRQDRPVVRLRAFVAGTGDTRRVQAIVSEAFTEKHLALPALSVVQIGALPMEGAQVLLEAVLEEKKPVNPGGLAFLGGEGDYVPEPVRPVVGQVEKVTAQLAAGLKSAGLGPEDMLRVGCYVTSLEDADKARGMIAAQFPRASLTYVQPLRAALRSGVTCDGVARLASAPAKPLDFTGTGTIALVGPNRVALSGTQLAFGTSQEDARLAFDRLGKSLERVTASYEKTALLEIYALSAAGGTLARRAAADFLGKATPPAETVLPFEGLPSMDASFAADVIVVLPETR